MKRTFSAISATMLLSTVAMYADVVGPTYPAPGGNNYSDTGAIGDNGGHTGFYTDFDNTAYAQLYWGLNEVDNVYNDAVSPGGNGEMTFDSYNASTGIATWESTSNLEYFSSSNQLISFPTELLVQVQPYTDTNEGELGAGWLDPTTESAVGISGSDIPVWNVTGNYQVWAEFVDANNGVGVDTLFNENNNGAGFIQTGYDGEFWYTQAQTTPEPGTLGLIGLALAGIGILKRRIAA